MADIKTLPTSQTLKGARRAGARRRIGRMVLAVVIIVGAMTLLGPRTGEVSAEDHGYRLRVEHPLVTRGGLAVQLTIQVERPSGTSVPVEIRIGPELINRFDFQNWWPNPDSETGTPDEVTLTFEPPPTDVFMTTLDGRTSPAENGSFGRYAIAVAEQGQEVVRVEFPMVVLP